MNTGYVYLVGAGCGRADLITLRGLEALGRCGAVVYDDLIDPALLAVAPAEARRVYVGKRGGRHAMTQEDISALLVSLAQEGREVVRLKGGDPYVFGRGGEEAMTLNGAGIPWEEVPGISSAIAIPAAAGIPVTHRGVSRGFHVVTGHTAGDGLPPDLERLAGLEGTLVFLMGLSHLEAIAQGLMEAGKAPSTPAAVLSGGNAPRYAAVRGRLDNIALLTRKAGVEPPAVILVGDVAALDLNAGANRPLEGLRVGLTGTGRFTGRVASLLRRAGACPLLLQRHEVVERPEALADWEPPGSGWLVFTSANGVEVFFSLLTRRGTDLRALMGCKFAAVGGATAAALWKRGFRADLCPEEHTTAALGAALLARTEEGERITLLRSARADDGLKEILAGRNVEERSIYHVEARSLTGDPGSLDYLAFGSAGAVRDYAAFFGPPEEGTACAAIGPVTAREVERLWGLPCLTASPISAEGLVREIVKSRRG